MYKSEVSSFNIVDSTPFKRDPVKELAEACTKRGIRFGVYYSQAQDWHEPGAAIWEMSHEGTPKWKRAIWDPHQEGNFDTYFAGKAIPQVKELLTNYGPLAIIWFDTPLTVMTMERAGVLESTVHDIQPDTLISGRLGGESQSDYDSEGDNRIPGAIRQGDWETPATLNDTWGFKKNDANWKKPADLVFNLVDIVSKGGNYLLNIGPDATGAIPQPSQDLLREVGTWLAVNGEAVYGCGPTPFGSEFGEFVEDGMKTGLERPFHVRKDWRCTTKSGVLYIHIFGPPGIRLTLNGVKKSVAEINLLADQSRTALHYSQTGDEVVVELPELPKDAIATVLRVTIGS